MDPTSPPTRPELLAPAGDWAALRAAVANGADAVYFGLQDFNARLRAANFAVKELPKVVGYLHDHNVRGYVTLNTLVFADELALAAERLTAIAEAGADAVIVQDLGLVPLARRFLGPSLPVHASTQMTLTEAGGIELVRRLGVQRVILARELSLVEIQQIAGATEAELEVFVHGALCISFSGQCLASLALGGRSANRGLCAQACRLPYQLVADGKPAKLGQCRHPLSPQDLAAYGHIAELVAMGVRGFKIEGRLKGADYVAAAVRVYRAALDAALEGRPFQLSRGQEEELAQGFSRGFTRGFLDGVGHQRLVVGHSPKGRGLQLGEVVGRTPRGVVVALGPQCRAKPGDGVVFDAGGAEGEEQGGRIVAVEPVAGHAGRVALVFHRGDVRLKAVTIGSIVWKTDDPEIRQRLEQSYARDIVAHPQPVAVRVRAALGEPLQVTFRDGAGHTATVGGDRPLERAEKHPLTLEVLREQLGRLGGTPLCLGTLDADPLDPAMVPKSVLNGLRRRAVEALLAQRRAAARHAIADPDALATLRSENTRRPSPSGRGEGEGRREWGGGLAQGPSPQPSPEGRGSGSEGRGSARVSVLVRDIEQLEAVLAWAPPAAVARPAMVYCDLDDPRQATEAVARVRAARMPVGLATLRILKPGDDGPLKGLLDLQPDAVLVRNLAALAFLRVEAPGVALVGDSSLNVANDLAANLLLSLGLDRLTPGPDLGWEQLGAMLSHADPGCFEIVVHQHVPMFHTQHCLFAARLSRGSDRGECGRPCRRRVELRDRVGESHPLLADAACRNTVYRSAARSASAAEVQRLWGMGVRHFRIELLRETPQQVRATLGRFGGIGAV